MKVDVPTIKFHFAGFSIPRHIVGKVLVEFEPFKYISVTDGYKALGDLKTCLTDIANSDETLTMRQKRLVERSYYVLKGDETTVNQQVVKDFVAIKAENNAAWEAYWPTFAKGARDFGKVERLSLDNIEPMYLNLWNKYISDDRATDIKDEQQRINYVVAKSKGRLARELQQWIKLPAGLKDSPVWDQVFRGIHLMLVPDLGTGNQQIGSVQVAQEKGYKARLFASPYLMYQVALTPLQKRLQVITSNIHQDCHRDQEEGVNWVMGQLSHGHRIHSFDLSAATHRFPWGVQIRMLRHLGVPKPILDLYTHVSKGSFDWHGENISWTAGQPLGTVPSFFAFSLAHHALVIGISRDLGVNPDCYRILGDDIVIANDKVAARYQTMMVKMGCVINTDKSAISKEFAEFAGAYITSEGFFRTGTLRPVNNSNRLSVSKTFTNRDGIKRKVREQLDVVAQFNAFTPFETGEMDPVVHRYIELRHSHEVALNLEVPDTVAVHDFAAMIVESLPQAKANLRQSFFNYYVDRMERLGKEIFSYTLTSERLLRDALTSTSKTSEWKMNTASPASLINKGIRELLRELSECPTQCTPLWVKPLMERRGALKKDELHKYDFVNVVRELIQLATTYKLTKPRAWMVDQDKFADKMVVWHKAARRHETAGSLLRTVLDLEEAEFVHRTENLTSGNVIHHVNNIVGEVALDIKPFRFDTEIAIW